MKKTFAVLLAALMSLGLLTACGGANTKSESGNGASSATASDGKSGEVYYLNFKPEQDEAWQNLAKKYTEETGVPVTVVTAASNTYEQQLMSEMAKSNPPTLFQVNGPIGLANWKDYCYDLTGSDVLGQLTSDSFALKEGEQTLGVAYVVESYGIIVNKALLEKAGYKVEDIQSFADLKKVAEDITARKAELGFAAFTSAGMDGSSNWRYQTHLANLPIHFEYEDKGISASKKIEGKYLPNYKDIFDLYINNSTCEPAALAGKTGDDSRNEFLGGQAVFFQNGSWEYGNLVGEGKPFTDADLAMIPIYIGAGEEAKQGLCTGTENFWCVNKSASEENIKATLDFINWCVTSETGTKAMAEEMNFVIPFKAAQESPNLFVNQDKEMTAAGKTPVRWDFGTIPSQTWKDELASALTAYTAGTGTWDDVVNKFVAGWESEYAVQQ